MTVQWADSPPSLTCNATGEPSDNNCTQTCDKRRRKKKRITKKERVEFK